MDDEIRERARSYFGNASPAHDWQHVRRVARLSAVLADEHGEPVDRPVLLTAAWLHDIDRPLEARGEVDDHAEWGAREAASVLASPGADDGTVSDVRHCIRAHRYSNDVVPDSPEARLLADADDLDALGAVGIARACAHGGEHGTPIHDPELPVEADDTPAGRTTLNHVRKKLLALPDRLYTDAGQRRAAQRAAFLESFLERFEREIAGKA